MGSQRVSQTRLRDQTTTLPSYSSRGQNPQMGRQYCIPLESLGTWPLPASRDCLHPQLVAPPHSNLLWLRLTLTPSRLSLMRTPWLYWGTHAILAGLVFIAKTQMQPKCYSQKWIKYTGYTHNAILLSHIEQWNNGIFMPREEGRDDHGNRRETVSKKHNTISL